MIKEVITTYNSRASLQNLTAYKTSVILYVSLYLSHGNNIYLMYTIFIPRALFLSHAN